MKSNMINAAAISKLHEEIKQGHQGALILVRWNDWYYAVGDDADEFGKITGATVWTKDGIKLCIFHSWHLDTYLPKLIQAGKRVAITDCDTAILNKKEEE